MSSDTSPPKAFSYLRFSTPEQAAGDSFRRQTKLAEDYARRHGLELDTSLSLSDLGVSAYRGSNARTGALGAFLKAITDDLVPVGSYLLVESFDRVTRQSPWDAFPVIQQIVNAGVTVVTLKDERAFSRAEFLREPMRLMEAIIVMIRANEESDTKSRRLKSAWENKRADAAEDTRPMTARAPAWLVTNKDTKTFDIVEERALVVRRIFDLILAGYGVERVAQLLNSEGVPTFGDTGSKRRARMWHRSYIKKISENPAVIGTFVPHTVEWVGDLKSRKAQGEINGYFPAIVPAEVYQAVQAMKRDGEKAPISRQGGLRSMFAGMAKCCACGASMTRVSKGEKGKAGKPFFVCTSAKVKAGCSYRAVSQHIVEQAFIRDVELLGSLVPSKNLEMEDTIARVSDVWKSSLEEIAHLSDGVAQSGSPTLVKALSAAEARCDALHEELKSLLAKAAASEPATQKLRLAELSKELSKSEPDVARINSLLRQVFQKIVIDYQEGCLRFVWQQGGEVPITYRLRPDGSIGSHVAAVVYAGEGTGRAVIVAPDRPGTATTIPEEQRDIFVFSSSKRRSKKRKVASSRG